MHVYADTLLEEETRMTREITLSKAVNEAIAEEMRRDDGLLIGEDVAEAGTPFKVLSGLVEEFGTDRVIDTPISEPGFMGIAVGAAMTGSRPIVDLMFGDFIYLVMDQLCNQAAKTHYMSGGKLTVPLVCAPIWARPAAPPRSTAVAAGAGRAYSGPEGRAALVRL
jgi:pyruvate/2-oxoglutarate/acetoin dehydrogenase E1 component